MLHKFRFPPVIWCSLIGFALILRSANLTAQPQGTVPLPIDTAGEYLLKEAVLEKVTQLHQAILNRDSSILSAYLDNDISYIHSNGLTQTKAEAIRSIITRQHDYRKIHPRHIELRIIAQGAIVEMDADVSLILEGKPIELDLHIQQIWMKQDDSSWKLVARQSTRNE